MNLYISEMFTSIQGESTWAGFPSFFIRLAGCNLRCSYCDTCYALTQGHSRSVREIITQAKTARVNLITITGGEPLLQKGAPILAEELVAWNFTVVMETNGSILLPKERSFISVVDFKCPGSGEGPRRKLQNSVRLQPSDEVKFVISDKRDFHWAVAKVNECRFHDKHVNVLFSPATGDLSAEKLAEWILTEKCDARLQVQLQKVLWPDGTAGV